MDVVESYLDPSLTLNGIVLAVSKSWGSKFEIIPTRRQNDRQLNSMNGQSVLIDG